MVAGCTKRMPRLTTLVNARPTPAATSTSQCSRVAGIGPPPVAGSIAGVSDGRGPGDGASGLRSDVAVDVGSKAMGRTAAGGEAAGVGVVVGVAIGVPAGAGVAVPVGGGVAVAVGLGVGEGVGLGVGEGVGLGVGEGVGLGVGEGVGLGVGEGVGDGVGLGAGTIEIESPLGAQSVAPFGDPTTMARRKAPSPSRA